ncbi:hypothetical protein EVAR_17167_1 [Eumeta japonica]|uniref:Uncharacterized protein n=1 Tax=Eumeta variegata TaxID=151549 RepID=A0A4C1U8Q2_EUMVA|nr:hypothetical protein EVAR_17167_1 [Eumeta japonica]
MSQRAYRQRGHFKRPVLSAFIRLQSVGGGGLERHGWKVFTSTSASPGTRKRQLSPAVRPLDRITVNVTDARRRGTIANLCLYYMLDEERDRSELFVINTADSDDNSDFKID